MTEAPLVGIPLGRNHALQALLAVYLALWTALAVAPHDRGTWLLENLLVFGLATLFAATHRRFMLSNLSLALVLAFLGLHAFGSHYTYSAVPLGDWVRDAFGLTRNHYDRVVHFAFGILLAYPMREITLRRLHVHGVWSYVVPLLFIVSISAAYEILEWGAARTASPEVGIAYVGAQGDVWDGQKDMLLALAGAGIAMIATALYRRTRGHEPYHGRLRRSG